MRKLKGAITSDKMQKTVVVRVDRLIKHPRYLKYYKASKNYKAHDEKNEYHTGDVVWITEQRPLSKEKRWRVAGLIRKASTPEERAEEADETSDKESRERPAKAASVS
ncbi:MAG: 30S ribosomal protein S17 [Patescibacteria group bacterium]